MKKSNLFLTTINSLKKKCMLFVLLMIAGGQAATAQTPTYVWAQSAGGRADNVAYSVTVDAKGSSYVAGSFTSPTLLLGSVTLKNTDSTGKISDMFVAKYDAEGNVIWAKSAGGTFPDVAYSVTADAGGNIYVVGYFFSPKITFGTTQLTNAGTCNIFIVKYDFSGNVVWAKNAGGSDYDYAYSVASDAGGNIYVAGVFASAKITFGSTTLTNAGAEGSSDMFIAKFDSNGNALWAQSAGGANPDVAYCVTVDATGNVLAVGYFKSPSITFGTTKLTKIDSYDMFLVKYDATGKVLFAKCAGGTDNDYANSVSTDAKGNIYVAVKFESPTITFGSTTLSNADNSGNSSDMFIVKYDSNGNALWAKSAGGTNFDYAQSVVADAAGNVYVAGYFDSPTIVFGKTTLTNVGSDDIFIVKYDTNGNVLWADGAGGMDYDHTYSIASDAFGNIYVAGAFDSHTINFGTHTLSNTGHGTDDMFFVKMKK